MVYLRKTELSQLYRKQQHKQRVKSPRIKKLSSTKNGDSQNRKKKIIENKHFLGILSIAILSIAI